MPANDQPEARQDALSPENVASLDQAVQHVEDAAIDIGDYDDESETLTHHAEALENAVLTIQNLRRSVGNAQAPSAENVAHLEQTIQQIMDAATDVGEYDDSDDEDEESSTLAHHADTLRAAVRIIQNLRNDIAAHV